jgi:hypothetical protein
MAAQGLENLLGRRRVVVPVRVVCSLKKTETGKRLYGLAEKTGQSIGRG